MVDGTIDSLLDWWEQATAALLQAEQLNPYSDIVDDLADEVVNARVALTCAGVRDIEAFATERAVTTRRVLLDAS